MSDMDLGETFKLVEYKNGLCPICGSKVNNEEYVLCEMCVHRVKKSALYTREEPTIARELSRISNLANGFDDKALTHELSLHYYKLLESTAKDANELAYMLATVVIYVLREIQGRVDEDDDNFACIVDYFGELFHFAQPEELVRQVPLENDELYAKIIDIFERLSIRDTISLITLTCACVSLAYEYDLNINAYELLVGILRGNF